jgi:Cu-Zn family superoxide dismutase
MSTAAVYPIRAICKIQSFSNSSNLSGYVTLEQLDSKPYSNIYVNISGASSNTTHGLHLHTYGDLSDGCMSTGPHYNPFNTTHGGPNDTERHVGDLGNVQADEYGNIITSFMNMSVPLQGSYSLIGRACVIHAGEDMLDGGKNVGGARVACGVIGYKQFV